MAMRRPVYLCVLFVALLAAATAGSARAGYNDASDIALTAAAPSDSFTTGSSLTYTITANDKGPATSKNVVVTASLTGGKAEISSATPQSGTCVISATKRHIACNLGMIDPNTSDQIALAVTADASGQLVLKTSVKQHNPDTDPSNQNATVQTKMVETAPPTGVAFTGTTFTHAILTRPNFFVSWTATDTGSRVASFDVRYRASAYNGSFGPYRIWRGATIGRRAPFTGKAGGTYCFSVRATDHDGNVSAWTPDRCVSILLGSPQLTRSGVWKLHRSQGGSASVSSHAQGAQLLLQNVVAKQLVIVATGAPGNGKLAVLWNGRLLQTFMLSAPTHRHLTLPLAPFAATSRGTLTLRVAAGHTVTVLGVAVRKVAGR